MGRLLIISNRLPVSIEKQGDELKIRQSSGGLVSAFIGFFNQASTVADSFSEKLWVGSMESSQEEWEAARKQDTSSKNFEVFPIFPDKALYDNYYNGFANSTLWPLFHYFPSLVENKEEYFKAYQQINQQFADSISEIHQPGDTIWVQDYQLMLLPQMIREAIPSATIGFFLHVPFPSYEIFRLMPTAWKKSLMQGILGSDLVGFHTHDYAQHFMHSARMILQTESQFNVINYGNRQIKADLFPIGIDYKKFREACIDDLVVGISTSLEEKFFNQKIIFSVDRLDYTKGLNYRLDSYEEFLTRYPEWIGKVTFIFNIVPSRDNIQTYSDRKSKIEEKVSTINGKFSTLHWQPLIYRYNHLSFEELCALYQVADAALITPLRDGMNLVAKEFIASCIDKGVLILSELTGAADELNEALLVNPTDILEVSTAINSALTMDPVEQRSRLSYMQRRVANSDVVKWIKDFVSCLHQTKKDQEKLKLNILKEQNIKNIIQAFQKADKRCVLLDYDGTLAPYQRFPALAAPSEELEHVLSALTEDKSNEVVIISGRDSETLEKWLGHLPLHLVAEHGAMVKYKNEEWKELVKLTTEWKDQIRPLLEIFVTRCPGSFIEEKKSTLAWHYRNTYPELGFSRSRELKNSLNQLTANTSLQVIDGNKVLEVRTIGIDKGNTAVTLVEEMQPDFVMCLGDDATDEDMFRSLRNRGITIKVGPGNTEAEYTMMSQKEVFPFLRQLASKINQIQSNA